eukprot:m.387638 g.387638  ORF g.387638 m.387638 type:complete len:53 (-) comp21034_c0_seq1:130-288(-)
MLLTTHLWAALDPNITSQTMWTKLSAFALLFGLREVCMCEPLVGGWKFFLCC